MDLIGDKQPDDRHGPAPAQRIAQVDGVAHQHQRIGQRDQAAAHDRRKQAAVLVEALGERGDGQHPERAGPDAQRRQAAQHQSEQGEAYRDGDADGRTDDAERKKIEVHAHSRMQTRKPESTCRFQHAHAGLSG